MNYIVLDLEWNQSAKPANEVKGIPFEIIEIGAIKLNAQKKMIAEFSELIKPSVYREMHSVTRKLIHLQMEELEKGDPFPVVMRRFLDWCGPDVRFCTWGPLDLTELQRNMTYYKMGTLSKKTLRFLDVQKLFSIAYEDRKSRRSLEYAVDFLKIEKDIPFHRAFSDAYYTAKVLQEFPDPAIEKNYSFDYYVLPRKRDDEIFAVFDTYAKYISRVFDDKQEAIMDRRVCSTKCYFCRRNLKRKIKWFTPNGKHYYSVSYCDQHGYMKGKIRIRKTEDDRVYAVKTLKFISEEEAKEIRAKRDKAREFRKIKRIREKEMKKGQS